MIRQILWASCLLAGLSAVAAASPMIGLDDPCPAGNPETAITTTSGTILLPLVDGGGVFCFYNGIAGGDQPITQLTLEAASNDPSSTTIVCESQFFAPGQCTSSYSGGILSINFSTNYTDGDEGPLGTDTEVNEWQTNQNGLGEGIPQLLDGCLAHPDTGFSTVTDPESHDLLPCSYKGHFLFNLDGGLDGHSGDWTAALGVTSMEITAVNGVTLNAPEPAPAALFVGLLLVAGGLAKRRVGQRA